MNKLVALMRPWWFPLLALALFEAYARPVAAGSDGVAPPSAALLAFGKAVMDFLSAASGPEVRRHIGRPRADLTSLATCRAASIAAPGTNSVRNRSPNP